MNIVQILSNIFTQVSHLILNPEFQALLLIFSLNILSNFIGTLKTIFVSKQMGKYTYFIVFIDALIYSMVLKSFTSSSGYLSILAFCFGKVVGSILADIVEKKLALGLVEVQVYISGEELLSNIKETMRLAGFSVTSHEGISAVGKPRYHLTIQLARKDMKKLRLILEDYGIEEPTMVVSEIKSVSGKIAERV